MNDKELYEIWDNKKLLNEKLRTEVGKATKKELEKVITTLADFAEQDNMENLYESDMNIAELMNCGLTEKETRILWIMKTVLQQAK